MLLERETFIAAPLTEVFAFFSDPNNLARITPDSMGFRIVDAPSRTLREGDRIEYRIRVAGIPVAWTTLITRWEENRAFADLQLRGPYRHWLHTHTFEEENGGVKMYDRVEYELPLGILGRVVAGWAVKRQLARIFDHREHVIRSLFASNSGRRTG